VSGGAIGGLETAAPLTANLVKAGALGVFRAATAAKPASPDNKRELP